jgi:hypothetical protein
MPRMRFQFSYRGVYVSARTRSLVADELGLTNDLIARYNLDRSRAALSRSAGRPCSGVHGDGSARWILISDQFNRVQKPAGVQAELLSG